MIELEFGKKCRTAQKKRRAAVDYELDWELDDRWWTVVGPKTGMWTMGRGWMDEWPGRTDGSDVRIGRE